MQLIAQNPLVIIDVNPSAHDTLYPPAHTSSPGNLDVPTSRSAGSTPPRHLPETTSLRLQNRLGIASKMPQVLEFAMTTITKRDLVSQIATVTKSQRDIVKLIMQAALDEIVKELCKGNRIEFRDFGVFEPKERPARRAQNPKTRLVQEVGPKRTVRFKAGRLMKDAVAGGVTEVNTLTRRKLQPGASSRAINSASGLPGAVELKLTGRRGNPRRASKPNKPVTDSPSLKLSSGL